MKVVNFFSGSALCNKMRDIRYYYVYENQRWNPLTGYTSRGLPTDRFMWSDVTGKYKRTKENTCLLSKRWRWVIQFHTYKFKFGFSVNIGLVKFKI